MHRAQPTVETILAEAVEIPSAEARQAFLAQAGGDDAALQREVERLVACYFASGSFLERPSAEVPTVLFSYAHEPPGTQIGPYKLREVLGEGGMGMGTVYVAEQERPVRRKVALKSIKPGMDTHQVIARFEAERQALALMDHPHIAKVLDAGATDAGRPYFVMELVCGVPIAEFCDQRTLPTRQRLALFVATCQAIQHAHQKGIIHRDIKPSNVLVTLHDDKPVVKVIDFGVAKAVNQQLAEHSVYTRFAQLVGTPLYMGPEQAELNAFDVDTRSDVYSDQATTSIYHVVKDEGTGQLIALNPVEVTGIGVVDTGLQTNLDYYHDVVSEAAQGATGGTAGNLLKASAWFYDPIGTSANDANFNASGEAYHRDIIFLNPAIQPESIRLTFQVDGTFAYSEIGPPLNPGWDYAGFGLQFLGADKNSTGGEVEFDLMIRGPEYNAPTNFSSIGWDSTTTDGLSYFNGTWSIDMTGAYHLDVAYDDQYGGYLFSAQMLAIAGGSNGIGVANFTAALTVVTDLDGNPLSDLSFDSGLTFGNAPVAPEPSSLCIAATGLLLGGLGRQRRWNCRQFAGRTVPDRA